MIEVIESSSCELIWSKIAWERSVSLALFNNECTHIMMISSEFFITNGESKSIKTCDQSLTFTGLMYRFSVHNVQWRPKSPIVDSKANDLKKSN